MQSKKKSTKASKSFKAVIVVLALVLFAGMIFMSNLNNRSKQIIDTLQVEKHAVLNDLEKSKIIIEQIQVNNKTLSKELLLEQKKVKQLIEQIKANKINPQNLESYKQNASSIDAKIKLLLMEINKYKKQVDSTNVVLTKQIIKNEVLEKSNKNLNKIAITAEKIYYHSLQNNFYKIRSSGNAIETKKANRINSIKTSFIIAENELAKPVKKVFFIQIIDSKNNVIGEKKEEKIQNSILVYSKSVSIDYKNKTTKVEAVFETKDLLTGNYFINVFDYDKLIFNASFELD